MGLLKNSALILIVLGASTAFAKKRPVAKPQPQPSPVFAQSYYTHVSGSARSCADEAQAIGEHFSRIENAINVVATCNATTPITEDGRQYTVYSIAVTYEAPRHVEIYSSILGQADISGSTSLASGIYPSYATCLNDLSAQTYMFNTETGLTALSAACEKENYSSVADNYVLKIDGIGRPVRRLQGFALSAVYNDVPQLQAQVAQLIRDGGISLALARNGTYLYYAERMLPIRQNTMAFFSSDALCRQELDDAQTLFGYAKSSSGFVGCVRTDEEYPIYTLVSVWTGGADITEQFIPRINYLSHNECEADKARVIGTLANTTTVYGAICDDSGSGFEMHVFGVRY